MKVSVVVKIARQVEGEYVLINPVTAFIDKDKARRFVENTTFMPAETINGIDYMIEMSVLQDIDVQDVEDFFKPSISG